MSAVAGEALTHKVAVRMGGVLGVLAGVAVAAGFAFGFLVHSQRTSVIHVPTQPPIDSLPLVQAERALGTPATSIPVARLTGLRASTCEVWPAGDRSFLLLVCHQ